MKHIIVGIKDPTTASELIAWTTYLAHALDARPIVVHAVQRSELWVVAGMQLDSTRYVRDVRRRIMHDIVRPLIAGGVDPTVCVTAGDPAHVLAAEAQRSAAGIILIGTTARAPVRDLIAGNVGHRLEHITHVPLVVVPATSAIAA
jgi:nucleotide-binding universal stress UspA family protein